MSQPKLDEPCYRELAPEAQVVDNRVFVLDGPEEVSQLVTANHTPKIKLPKVFFLIITLTTIF